LETEGFGLFLSGNRFKDHSSFHAYRALEASTNDTTVLIDYVKMLFNKFTQQPFPVKRVGIYFFNLQKESQKQLSLLPVKQESKELMKTIDEINKKFPLSKIRRGSESKSPQIMMLKNKVSSLYTTNWNDLLKIKI